MIPELAYTMLACARIGAIHSIVFGGFSAESHPRPHPRRRLQDGGHRQRGPARRQAAPAQGDRGPGRRRPRPGRDRAGRPPHRRRGADAARPRPLARRGDAASSARPAPVEWMGAEDPLFILYTSGSTGKPKGVLHTTGGYLVYAAMTHQLVFDYHPGDVYFCAADIGWITGHSYIIYGPLANGATTVMFESIPTYPDAGRYWQIVDDLGVNIFYTAPTAIRAIARAGDELRHEATRAKSLRILGTVGEPINPEIWRWYHDVVGEGRCAVVDTWWQTETGGILITPLPGRHAHASRARRRCPSSASSRCWWTTRARSLEGNGVSRQPLHRAVLAGAGAHGLGRPRSASTRPTSRRFPGLLLHRRRLPARRGRLLLDHRPRRRRAQRLRPPPGHRRGRERAGRPRGGRRGRGGRLPARDQGHRASSPTSSLNAGVRAAPTADELVGALKEQVRHVIGPIATPDAIHDRARPAQDPLAARSCAASCARSPPASTRTSATSPPSPIPTVVEKLIEEHKELMHG